MLPRLHTRHLFFTGKGGVGKTSLASACAVRLAEAGRRVLLVSTDPASNLDEVLETRLSDTPTRVTGVPGLSALNIDPEAAAAAYRERMVGPYRSLLPEAAIRSMEEQFSGGCTVEIAAFDAFAALLAGTGVAGDFDHVVFDTAPTGHTLRLLTLPSAWSEFLSTNTTGTSCLGPLAGLEHNRSIYAAAVAALTDAAVTTVVLVARPEPAALREAERSRHELAELGVANQVLAINGLFDAPSEDPVAQAMARRHRYALAAMPAGLAALPRSCTGFIARGLVGLEALRALLHPVQSPTTASPAPDLPALVLPPGLAPLVDDIERAGHGLVMTMGKGGVGKTTVAAAVAVALAARGHRVLLSTTDPAAHLAWSLDEAVPGLTVQRIDPTIEVARHRDEVLARAGAGLDPSARAMLEEDLRSPCTEEIAVFRAFAATVAQAAHGFVVLDTAPTGHTVLLMDSAEAYHREVGRTRGDLPEAVVNLLPRLRDPEFTRVLVVTLAEATPVHEAERLQDDLRRAGIEPFAWVIEQSLLASGTTDPVLAERGRCERPWVQQVMATDARRCALLAWQARPPVGAQALRELAGR
ncbi:MAG: arsenical pump-driving ATPase [Sphaerotilus natans subsp. sulfidivorans]|uniref:arsenical pump-driving ATPase n=1 Tax=Sphaerotilus sulfidivorans TaxID=639200 RepID=UPI00235482E5|nr:arsenical pump-driving ATPase [Sphaerotilus sulfidivorans]MCK6403500.1 arsenical pump-driving ATPase [Sphaerotilus sulfidivorans]